MLNAQYRKQGTQQLFAIRNTNDTIEMFVPFAYEQAANNITDMQTRVAFTALTCPIIRLLWAACTSHSSHEFEQVT